MSVRNYFKTAGVALGVLLFMTGGLGSAWAQTDAGIADKLSEAIRNYSELEFDKGLDVAQNLLIRKDLSSRDSIGIYSVMSMLTYGKGTKFIDKSFGFLKQIAGIGPCEVHLPYGFWPQQLRDQWYRVVNDQGALVCPDGNDGKVKTIAIMEFDNFSVGEYQEELGFITKGLADFFEADFAKISDLRVVERDKIEFILKELELSASGAVETSTAVKIGKMLGAQIMIFGSITQLSSKEAKMLVKAVKVETSEIITSVERTGKPKYFKMQKELVVELVEKLDVTLNEETKNLLKESGSESEDAAGMYSQGLYYMDKYDYKKAYEYFKKAYDKDPGFAEAKRKMEIYRPLAT